MRWAIVAMVASVTACSPDDRFLYQWDERRVVCSRPVDDLGRELDWYDLEADFASARDTQAAFLVHAHQPGTTISRAHLERIFDRAESLGLAYVTFSELQPSEPRGALAFALDDSAVEDWFSIRELLQRRAARITFFVTRFPTIPEAQREQLAALVADGHEVAAHGIDHLNAPAAIAMHGLDSYLADEVYPSFDVLEAAGYAPTSFAFPFGLGDDAATTMLLEKAQLVRVGPGTCPY